MTDAERRASDLPEAFRNLVAEERDRAKEQLDSLLKALEGEVENRRAVARSMNAEPHWAGRTSPVADAIEAWADRLQKIIDQHKGGQE